MLMTCAAKASTSGETGRELYIGIRDDRGLETMQIKPPSPLPAMQSEAGPPFGPRFALGFGGLFQDGACA